MEQTHEAIINSAEAWMSKPVVTDIEAAITSSYELAAGVVRLMKEDGVPKEQLGPLLGRIKGMRKALENLELMDWVEFDDGALAIGHRPGAKLATDLKLQNATHVLTLLSEGEQAKAIQSLAEKNGLKWLWFPMSSALPPGEDRYTELVEIFNEMKDVLENGGKVYVHCSAGIHRTGMISYVFLRFLGKEAEESMKLLSALRAKTSEEVGVERIAWGNEEFKILQNL